MTDEVLEAALGWAYRHVGVVPIRPRLIANDKGKLSPHPWIRWQQEGPVRTVQQVHDFWEQHPEAQLAILLEDGLVAVDLDLQKLKNGQPPARAPLPDGPGYCETTKGGGRHYLFRIKEFLDPARSSRVTQLADYVDVLSGGLLVVAPSKFENAERGYELVNDGLPVFPTMGEALTRYAPWLFEAWRVRWVKSKTITTEQGMPKGALQPAPARAWAVDLEELDRAIQTILSDSDAHRFFTEGYLHPNGEVDHSQTEYRVVGFLKSRGFSMATCWTVVRLCEHAKSPFDRRGRSYFEVHVWGRLAVLPPSHRGDGP